MDTTTKNPRVVAIHLSRIEKHLTEAFREANRIDPEAFPPEVIITLRNSLGNAWADVLKVTSMPVIITEKEKVTKAVKAIVAPILITSEDDDCEELVDIVDDPYAHLEEMFDKP